MYRKKGIQKNNTSIDDGRKKNKRDKNTRTRTSISKTQKRTKYNSKITNLLYTLYTYPFNSLDHFYINPPC